MYTFKNTEINNKKASEFETKSLLYLIGMRSDSDEIEFLTADCFNDVTGANEDFTKLWDVQSKNHASLPPSKIGKSLFTLYDNYVSTINFCEYILFIPRLKPEYLNDKSLRIYSYDNIENKTKLRIEKKLRSEIARVNDDFSDPPLLFKDFLNSVIFVEDNKKISTYIKKIAKFRNKKIVSEEFYENIFDEIRNIQTGLKNSTYIENISILRPIDVLKFNRHITKRDIYTLLISRLLGVEIFSFQGIPFPFHPVIKDMDIESIKDLIDDCNANLSRAFFDKNDCKCFWKVTENILGHLKVHPSADAYSVYDYISGAVDITTEYLTKETVLYMISLIKTGVEHDR